MPKECYHRFIKSFDKWVKSLQMHPVSVVTTVGKRPWYVQKVLLCQICPVVLETRTSLDEVGFGFSVYDHLLSDVLSHVYGTAWCTFSILICVHFAVTAQTSKQLSIPYPQTIKQAVQFTKSVTAVSLYLSLKSIRCSGGWTRRYLLSCSHTVRSFARSAHILVSDFSCCDRVSSAVNQCLI